MNGARCCEKNLIRRDWQLDGNKSLHDARARRATHLSRSQRQTYPCHHVVPGPLFTARILNVDAVDDATGKIAAAIKYAPLVRSGDCEKVAGYTIIGEPLAILRESAPEKPRGAFVSIVAEGEDVQPRSPIDSTEHLSAWIALTCFSGKKVAWILDGRASCVGKDGPSAI